MLVRVWPDHGVWHAGAGGVRLAFHRMDDEHISYAYRLRDVYYAYNPNGELVTTFTIRNAKKRPAAASSYADNR
jgi:hypothetical protein